MKNQRISSSELEKLQEKKLRLILEHAYYKVDYYRELFEKAGIKPEDIKTIQDLVKIPITTRKEFQALPKRAVIAKDVDPSRCFNLRTSGSTGMPLDIFIDGREIMFRWLFYRRMYFENGGKLSDRIAWITNPRNFRTKKWFQYLGILQEKYISLFKEPEDQLKAILEFRPDIIGGYVSTLKNLAIEIKKKRIKDIKPRIIFSTAELMSVEDRRFIASAFQTGPIDYYGCNECGIIASECEERFGYHINSDKVIVEFIKEDGTKAKTGEEAEIVITSLYSYTMPFIRYKLGDIGIFSDERCPCGRGLPLMKTVRGRVNDYIILPNGKKISPYRLMITMDKISEVKRYQIIQEKENSIRINIFQNERLTAETIAEVKNSYKELLDDDIEVEVIAVKDTLLEKKDKFKVISSKISDNNDKYV